MEDNRLLPKEFAWLQTARERYEGATADMPKERQAFTGQLAFLDGLLDRRVIRAEDRVRLMLTLRLERWLCSDDGQSTNAAAEHDFINSFLKRLSQMDWEAPEAAQEPYSSERHWGGFRITELETQQILGLVGLTGMCLEPRQPFRAGDILGIISHSDSGEDALMRKFTLELTRVHPCAAQQNTDGLPCLLFEGWVVNNPSDNDAGDEAFGFLFADGRVRFVDSSPDSAYTCSHLRLFAA